MKRDQRRIGHGRGSTQKGCWQAVAPDGNAPSVLAIGLESLSWREGGLNRYFSKLVGALGELGTPIVGLAMGDGQGGDEQRLVEIVSSPSASMLTRVRALSAAANRHADADIVDAHFALSALPLLFGRLRRRPLVVHFQGPWADESAVAGQGRLKCGLKRRLEHAIYRRANAFVVLSRSFRRVLVERYDVSPWAVHVMPPGVDTETFALGDQSEARTALGLPHDALVVLSVRRLVPRMGLDVLLEAWEQVVNSSTQQAILCIVGAGRERSDLEALTRDLGIADVVRFAGRVDDSELVQYYQAADISIVPSIALEGYGLVVLESLAVGTPVVASAIDGLSEALDGLAPDLLVSPGRSAPIAERLQGAMTGAVPLPTADACRRHAEGFSWSEVARRHLELYRRLVAQASNTATLEPRKLRVVVLGHSAQLSGGELAIQRTIAAMTDVEVHVILAEDGPLVPLLERAGASVEVLPMDDRSRNLRKDRVQPGKFSMVTWLQSAIYVLRLARRLARVHPDLVHTNTLKAALYGGMAARLAGIPCVWHIRDRIAPDYLPSFAVNLVRVTAKLLPTAIIANSEATLETVAPSRAFRNRAGYGHEAVVIPSPVLLSPARPALKRSSAGFRVAMVGRLAPWKGQNIFLQAFAKAFPDGEEVAVLVGSALFGEDGYERQLRELVRDLGIAERVEFRGFRSDVVEELSCVDALVHASIIPEPFGQVILDGMAAGLPVVAARAGGPMEILTDGKTGLLYPPGDVDALASLLRRLADDVELRSRLGAQARKVVVMYSPERVAEQILDVYEQVVRRGISKHNGNGTVVVRDTKRQIMSPLRTTR